MLRAGESGDGEMDTQQMSLRVKRQSKREGSGLGLRKVI